MLDVEARGHGVRILAWCLMTNHVHLILVPDDAGSLARALGQTHSRCALSFNQAEDHVGHLWQNRFFSCALDGSHLMNAIRYVELNPVRAGLLDPAWTGSFPDWDYTAGRSASNPV